MYIYVYIHILIWSLYKKYYHSKQLRLFDHTTLATFLFWFVFEWSKSRVGRFPPLNYAAWQENSGLHNHLVEWRFDEACHNPQESVISDLYTLRIGVINWHLTGSLRHKMNFKWCDLYILGCIDMHVYNIISVLIYNFQTLLMSCPTNTVFCWLCFVTTMWLLVAMKSAIHETNLHMILGVVFRTTGHSTGWDCT